MPKKTEKLPLQKAVKHFDSERPIPDVMPHIKEADVLEPLPGVAPKMTGKVVSTEDVAATGFDYFNFGEGEGPVTNPAATYLDGGNFDKVSFDRLWLSLPAASSYRSISYAVFL